MDHLNSLGYTWIHYGQQLYCDPTFICSDGYQTRYSRRNWYPQGTSLVATKIGKDIYIIDSITSGSEEDYYCWFLVSVDHVGRRILYQWIKGDCAPHTWILRCGDPTDKNCVADFDHGDQIIQIQPLIVRARDLIEHLRNA